MRQVKLFVGGMSSRRCVREVTARLRDVPAVETVSANPAEYTVQLSGSMRLPNVLAAFTGTSYQPRVPEASDGTESEGPAGGDGAGTAVGKPAGDGGVTADPGWFVTTEGHSCPLRLPLRKTEAAAAGSRPASSPRPSSWWQGTALPSSPCTSHMSDPSRRRVETLSRHFDRGEEPPLRPGSDHQPLDTSRYEPHRHGEHPMTNPGETSI